MDDDQTCGKVHLSPTATGDKPVACTKKPGHVEAGDQWHEGKLGFFPVRWTDES